MRTPNGSEGIVAKYVGETIRIATTATDFDGETALTDADLDSVELTIYDAALAVVVGPVAMTWNATYSHWAYDWDTSAAEAATYRLKVQMTSGTTESWEYGRLALKTNPV